MFYHLPPILGLCILFLPFIAFRIQLYRSWTEKKRKEGEKPGLYRFMGISDRRPDFLVFIENHTYLALQCVWALLMFFPFHLL